MPRPEKCPFCSAPVAGEELACRQCGFDLASDWQPASEEEARGVFDPRYRPCNFCGALNPITANTCSSCHLLMGSDPLGVDPKRHIACAVAEIRAKGPETRKARNLRRWLAVVLIAGGIAFFCMGLSIVQAAGWKGLAVFAPLTVIPIGFGLLLLWHSRGAALGGQDGPAGGDPDA